MFDVKDKTAIVTGAAGGIGLAVAKAILAKGGKVVLCDVADDKGAKAANALGSDRVAFKACNVANEEDVKAAVAFAVERFGSLDVMCANAGVTNRLFNGAEAPFAEFKRVVEIDQYGVFLCMKYAVEQMQRQGAPGAIVCTASMEGLIAAPSMMPYNAAKAAVINMVRCGALAHAKDGIRFNAVAPGYVMTEMASKEALGEEIYNSLIADIPLARGAHPEEIAHAYLFLIENEFVTGTTVVIDGGFTAK